MKKKSLLAILLACALPFAMAGTVGCNLIDPEGSSGGGSSQGTGGGSQDSSSGSQDSSSGSQSSGGGSQSSGGGSQDSSSGSQTPGSGTQTPGSGTENPGSGTENPGGGTENPGSGSETPGGGDVVVSEGITYTYYGNECAAFEWVESTPASAKVYYKLDTANSYTQIDKQLVRAASSSGKARADIVGLKGSEKYDFKIQTSSGKQYTAENVVISAHDRSGYAHFGNNSGVGAYNNDGTLKSGARVYYVTEATKNNIDGNNNSIAQFMNSLSSSSPATVIRIVGTVKCPQYLSANNLDKSITDINGITRKSLDNNTDSYWNMIDIEGAQNVTLEGIGEDATIFQFGFTWKKCQSIEVRNLTFTDYPEDACAFEGNKTSPTDHKNFWLHHSVFNIGKNGWDLTKEHDKGEGDGATDLKGVSNVTFSYLQYNDCHKTGLVGGGGTHMTCNVTFHHNYYNGNDQRMPLGRQANMHMYNNYYYQSTSYSISLRSNAYAFIEYNYFDNSNGETTIEARTDKDYAYYGYGKLWKNEFKGSKGFSQPSGGNYIVEATSRTQAVANTNTFNQNFDTDPSAFYCDATTKETKVANFIKDTSQIPELIPQQAGVQKHAGTAGSGGTTESGGSETPEPTPGGGSETPEPTPGAEATTITVIDNFKAAHGATTFTLAPSPDTAQYFDSTKLLSLYTTDNSKTFYCTDTYVKIQSANKIEFITTSQLPAGAKLVLTMDSTNEAAAVKVNGTNVSVVGGKVTVDLASGTTYTLGKASGETRIASISIVIPA